MRFSRPSPALVLAALALVLAAGGVAIAAPGDGAVINACTNNLRGTLRVVDAGQACAADETALTWNQQGPAGPAGPQGERGPAGSAGTPGERGSAVELGGPDTADPAIAKTVAEPVAKPKKKIKLKISPTGEPTNAFEVRRQSVLFQETGAFDPHPMVLRLEVPAGKYFVLATGLVYGEEPLLMQGGGCILDTGDPYHAMPLRPENTMALTLVVSFKTPSGIELRCARRSARVLGLRRPKISAINVARISSKEF